MKLELTEEEAQKVINSQRDKINQLHLRLRKAHVYWKYLDRASIYLRPDQITAVVKHLQSLIDNDQPEDYNDDFFYQYDHEVLEDQIKQYEDLRAKPGWNDHSGIRVPMMSFLAQFVIHDYDEQRARSAVDDFEGMAKHFWKEGEEPAPDFFSSPGLSP